MVAIESVAVCIWKFVDRNASAFDVPDENVAHVVVNRPDDT